MLYLLSNLSETSVLGGGGCGGFGVDVTEVCCSGFAFYNSGSHGKAPRKRSRKHGRLSATYNNPRNLLFLLSSTVPAFSQLSLASSQALGAG